jgi:hypothetical protein
MPEIPVIDRSLTGVDLAIAASTLGVAELMHCYR